MRVNSLYLTRISYFRVALSSAIVDLGTLTRREREREGEREGGGRGG